ncbi:MAG: J domain-containing protein [Desulfobacterales bacterium]
MNKYEKITRARKILELPETATIEEIKAAHRRLMHRWHPDLCNQDSEKAHEMTRKINEAYQTLLDYCANYRYSFCEEAVKRQRNPGEWWMEQFGFDPLWTGKDKDK